MFARNVKEVSPEIIHNQKSPNRLGHACTVFAVITVLLVVATTATAIFSPQWGEQANVLSLGQAAPLSEDPLFMVESAADARYLRGAVGIDYDEGNWKLVKIEGNGLEIYSSRDRLPLHPTEVAQTCSDYDSDTLDRISFIDDPQYLEMPDSISNRLKDLSHQITEGFDTPFEKARAIEVFLKVNYTYNLGFTPAPDNWEKNDWFLFESEEGICGNFASAFVILARASDIPSRLGAGYFVRAGEGEQTVYEDEAHAWAEVGFEDVGWLVFDAT